MAKAKQPNAGASLTGQQIEDIPHETVILDNDSPNTQKVVILSTDQQIKNEVAKFNVADNAIAALKKKYGKLTIANVEDKDGYKKTVAAWQEVRNKRLAVEKKHKEIKADYLSISKAIDGEKNRLVELLEPLEDKLKAEITRIDQLKEAAKEEAARKEAEQLANRVNELQLNGMAFNGSYYAIGEDITMDVVTLKDMPEDSFSALLERVKVVKAGIDKAEEERKQKEADEKKKQEEEKESQRLENIRLQKLRDDLAADQKKMEDEKAAIRKQRTEGRTQQIEALGMGFSYPRKQWEFRTNGEEFLATLQGVESFENDEFSDFYSRLKTDIEKAKAAQKMKDDEAAKVADEKRLADEKLENEQKAKQQRYELRANTLRDLFGMELQGNYFTVTSRITGEEILINKEVLLVNEADEWEILFEKIKPEFAKFKSNEKEAQKKLDEKAEEDRVKLLSDKEKAREYLAKIQSFEIPKGDYCENLFDDLKNEIFRLFQILSEA